MYVLCGSKIGESAPPPIIIKVKNQLFEQVAKKLEVDASDLVAEDGMIKSKSDAGKSASLFFSTNFFRGNVLIFFKFFLSNVVFLFYSFQNLFYL